MCLHDLFKQKALFLSYIWINLIFSFPLWFIAVYWMQFSVVYGRNLTFIFYIISVYLLIPNSKFISLLSLFDSHTFVFYVCVYFCFVNKFICNIFQIPCIIAIILYSFFSFWFPTLRMTISRSIHVTANDISHSFWWQLLLLLLSHFSRVWLSATPENPCPWDSPGKNTGVGCHFLLQCMKVKSESEVAQLCLILSNPMDCSLLGSSVHGIFQAEALEWGTTAFSIWWLSSSLLYLLHLLYSFICWWSLSLLLCLDFYK